MKRFLECSIPTTLCNLKCEYCYVRQENRSKNQKACFKFSPEHIGKALSVKRLGGVSFISMTAPGETLLPGEITGITHEILKQGHYVNITTNGTISHRFDEILNFDKTLLSHLNFSFSFHYLELLRTNRLSEFFGNIRKIREAGCSFVLQINLYDGYVPYWEEIKQISLREVGALPQVALTRDESCEKYKILTKMPPGDYMRIGKEMDSPLFDFTCGNFMVKRKEFCYAGAWSAKLDMATGLMPGCYGNGVRQNIFENPDNPIKFEPIGSNCCFQFCFNSSHFMSLGVIPEIPTPSYGALRNRKEAGWYSEKMDEFLSEKLSNDNPLYGGIARKYVDFKYKIGKIIRFPLDLLPLIIRKIK